MSRARLIEAFRENEHDLVSFLVARLRSAFVAQDLAQDLYIKVCSLDETPPVRNCRAYLFRMASNLAIDHLRGETRQAAALAEARALLEDAADHATPERTVIARDEFARLERVLAGLPPLSRRIFYLSRFEERSHREIAEIVGLSPAAVFKRLRMVLDRLAAARDPEA